MTDPEKKTCSRPGCGKKLRSMNTKGVCATGCLSPEAPPFARAKSAPAAKKREAPKSKADSEALERFRVVAEALGFDADDILNTFAEEWLRGLRERVEP